MKKLTSLLGKTTQKEALYSFLEAGHEFTVADAINAGCADPRRVVNQLRDLGFPVYLNDRTLTTGETVRRYRLGTARKNG